MKEIETATPEESLQIMYQLIDEMLELTNNLPDLPPDTKPLSDL